MSGSARGLTVDIDRLIEDVPGLGAAFSRVAAVHPDGDAIVCGPARVTWRDADGITDRIAHALIARDVHLGDIVALVLPNRVETIELMIATWKLGAIPLPLNARMPDREAREVEEIAHPVLRITGTRSTDGRDSLPLDDLLAELPLPQKDPLPVVPTRPWKAITSGGSTGRPKVILAVDDGPRGATARSHFRARPWGVSLIPGPLYFNGPFSRTAMTLLAGSKLVLMERFEAEAYLELIERERATWSLTVPQMWSRVMDLPEATRRKYDLSSLETIVHTGSPMPEWLKRQTIEFLGAQRVVDFYGSTEVAGTLIDGEEWLAHPGSVGRPLPGYQIEIRSEAAEPVPVGTIGEIWTRPPTPPTFRYLGAEPRVDAAGFVSVGDLGRLDSEGYLYIADRRTDLILSGGSNVYPAEVEAALLQHPAVRDVVIVGLPDPAWGERVHAIIEPSDAGTPPTLTELDTFVRTRLSPHKAPKSYEMIERIPRDPSGKVRRLTLKQERAQRQ